MSQAPGTNRQVPDHSIMDHFNKQKYLGNEFIYSIGSVEVTSTAETPLILLSNPVVTAASFPAQYKSLFQSIKRLTTLTASQNAILRIYFNPTVTGIGTPETPVNLRPASPNMSIAALSINPTVSANGTIVDIFAAQALATGASDLLIILDPGQSILVTVQTSSATTFIAPEIGWYEI